MFVKILKGKLHRATVTDTKLHYPGSIEIKLRFLHSGRGREI
ncbi:MAG: aspartate 1-decarboxylase [Planctomycetota bacterium]